MSTPTSVVRYRQGIPVYRYDPAPGVPPVQIFGLDAEHLPGDGIRHIHEFPVIVTDGESASVVRPGAVIDPAAIGHAPGTLAIAFEPSAVDARLLGLMQHDADGGLVRVTIPTADQDAWRHTVRQIEIEAEQRSDGYRDALVAHLSVLLIQLNRLAAGAAEVPEASLQAVFAAIEEGFRGPLALADVAKTVGLTPGYLTTWVRKRTGRTVQEWIIARKLVEARRLLAESDLPVASVGRAAGFGDPAYFSRMFTREVGMSPRRWRAGLPGR
jgi:AraC family transcriptional activator of pobA